MAPGSHFTFFPEPSNLSFFCLRFKAYPHRGSVLLGFLMPYQLIRNTFLWKSVLSSLGVAVAQVVGLGLGTEGWRVQDQHRPVGIEPWTAQGAWLCGRPLALTSVRTLMHVDRACFCMCVLYFRPACVYKITKVCLLLFFLLRLLDSWIHPTHFTCKKFYLFY